MEANENNLQSSDWSTTNNDVMMYSAPQSSSSTTMQYAQPRMLQTFTTVQLPDGGFQLTPGTFQQIYMTPANGSFERISSEVDFQSSNITATDGLSQVQTVGDNRQHISVPFMMTSSQIGAISTGSLGFGYTSILQNLSMGTVPGLSIEMSSTNGPDTPTTLDDVQEIPSSSAPIIGSVLSIGQYNGVIREARHSSSVFDQLQLAPCSTDETDFEQLLADADTDYNNQENGQSCSPEDLENRFEQEDNIVVRKSMRIAQRERTPSPVQRPKYVPKSYTVFEIWCEDCQTSYAGECPDHKLQLVYDKVVQSRAWSSLPIQLQIFRLSETTPDQLSELGVFAKRLISKRVQFGPFIANMVLNPENLTSKKFLLPVERDNGVTEYIDAVDENCCNWMMFVRPAMCHAEQNLVAYQYGADIYFSTIKPIEARQELKVWYAAHYAERLGVVLHSVSQDDQKEMDELEKTWPCYECSEKFRTSALLHKHLAIHDDLSGEPSIKPDDPCELTKRSGRKPKRRSMRNSKQTGDNNRTTLKNDNMSEEDVERGSSFQS